jgi:hypothetical protein
MTTEGVEIFFFAAILELEAVVVMIALISLSVKRTYAFG